MTSTLQTVDLKRNFKMRRLQICPFKDLYPSGLSIFHIVHFTMCPSSGLSFQSYQCSGFDCLICLLFRLFIFRLVIYQICHCSHFSFSELFLSASSVFHMFTFQMCWFEVPLLPISMLQISPLQICHYSNCLLSVLTCFKAFPF